MKHLIILLCLIPSLGIAQFQRGEKLLGGVVQFNNQNFGSDVTVTEYSIVSQFGLLVSENLALGVISGINNSDTKSSTSSISGSSSDGYIAGIFARRYFELGEKFLISIDGIIYNREDNYSNVNTAFFSGNTLGVAIQPVFSFFPTKRWGLEASFASLSYESSDITTEIDNINTLSVNYGTLNLGLTYYFRKKSD